MIAARRCSCERPRGGDGRNDDETLGTAEKTAEVDWVAPETAEEAAPVQEGAATAMAVEEMGLAVEAAASWAEEGGELDLVVLDLPRAGTEETTVEVD